MNDSHYQSISYFFCCIVIVKLDVGQAWGFPFLTENLPYNMFIVIYLFRYCMTLMFDKRKIEILIT